MFNGKEFDGEESNGMAFDGDYIDKNANDIKEHLIARSYDLAVEEVILFWTKL
jgi:hypothetical protein